MLRSLIAVMLDETAALPPLSPAGDNPLAALCCPRRRASAEGTRASSWVTAACRHHTPKCTFKGGFKAEFEAWELQGAE